MNRVPWEIRAVLALIVLDGIAVIATYSRFPAQDLYHVRDAGTAGAGLGRELVALNFPFALVGIALVGLAWPRLRGRMRIAAAVAIALCAVVYFAVDQSDLDAKPANAVPALGLALAVTLVLAVGVPAARQVRGDRFRIGLAVVLVLFCAPLIAAELGFYLDSVPLLGRLFETGRLTTQPGVRGLHHAVHHGQHHGWEATMLSLTALGFSRLPRPSVLVPAANWGWAAIVVGAVAVWRLWFRQPSRTTPAPASTAISSSG